MNLTEAMPQRRSTDGVSFNYEEIDRNFSQRLKGLDPEHVAIEMLPFLLPRAEAAREHLAISYRDFLVGASALAIDDRDGRIVIITGGNNSPYKGAPRNCAEMTINEKAKKENLTRILSMIVVGESLFDDTSLRKDCTLHMCVQCRGMAKMSPLFTDRTHVVTYNPSTEIAQYHDFESMLQKHEVDPPVPDKQQKISQQLAARLVEMFGPQILIDSNTDLRVEQKNNQLYIANAALP